MPEIQPLLTAGAPRPKGTYSQGLRVGDTVYTCGVGPRNPETGTVEGSTIEEQTLQALANLTEILKAGGADLTRVVSLRAYLTDLEQHFIGFDGICAATFSEPYPVRTTIGATLMGILVELDAVAVVEQ